MTLGELKENIATRLNRPDLLTAVSPSTIAIIPMFVSDRIRYYQKSLWTPSEVLDLSVTTIPSQNTYAFAQYPNLVGTQWINNIYLLQGSIWIPLARTDWFSDILEADVLEPPFVSLPSWWSVYGPAFRLYPTPSAPYPLKIECCLSPPEPAADDKSNFWTEEAATCIIEAVCADICRLTLNDDARATAHQWAAQREADSLTQKTRRLRGPATVRAWI